MTNTADEMLATAQTVADTPTLGVTFTSLLSAAAKLAAAAKEVLDVQERTAGRAPLGGATLEYLAEAVADWNVASGQVEE